jgi:hypothetical protein
VPSTDRRAVASADSYAFTHGHAKRSRSHRDPGPTVLCEQLLIETRTDLPFFFLSKWRLKFQRPGLRIKMIDSYTFIYIIQLIQRKYKEINQSNLRFHITYKVDEWGSYVERLCI